MIQKVQAFIYRHNQHSSEILIFEHDVTKVHQLIRGTVEKNEAPEKTVLREIIEESGLANVHLIKKLGETILEVKSGPTRSGPLEKQLHHAFLLEANESTLDKWTHEAKGSKEEEGLKFHFYWAKISHNLENILFEDFKPFIPQLLRELSK